ncbi:MAG: MurR/RpiR family transcriptional regulator [Casimicrobiaceae bacterium]
MAGVTRYEHLAKSITDAYPGLPARLQDIARFALGNPDALALGTVAHVAREARVPPSAVVRFANALGFTGFTDLQKIYRERLVARSATYRERIETLRRDGRDRGSVMAPLVASAIVDLERLREHEQPDKLREAASLLLAAGTVFLLAQRRAFPIASYLSYALAQLELPALLLDNVGGMLRQQAAAARRDDVLVVASFRNYSPDVIETADHCAARGVAVVAITDQPVSPLARAARVRFDVGDDLAQPFRSLVAPLCVAQALVMAVGYAMAEQRPARRRAAARLTPAQRKTIIPR